MQKYSSCLKWKQFAWSSWETEVHRWSQVFCSCRISNIMINLNCFFRNRVLKFLWLTAFIRMFIADDALTFNDEMTHALGMLRCCCNGLMAVFSFIVSFVSSLFSGKSYNCCFYCSCFPMLSNIKFADKNQQCSCFHTAQGGPRVPLAVWDPSGP